MAQGWQASWLAFHSSGEAARKLGGALYELRELLVAFGYLLVALDNTRICLVDEGSLGISQ